MQVHLATFGQFPDFFQVGLGFWEIALDTAGRIGGELDWGELGSGRVNPLMLVDKHSFASQISVLNAAF